MKLRDKIAYGGCLAYLNAIANLRNKNPGQYINWCMHNGYSLLTCSRVDYDKKLIEISMKKGKPAAYILNNTDLIFARDAIKFGFALYCHSIILNLLAHAS